MHRFWGCKNIDVSFILLIIWAVVLFAISFLDSLQALYSWVIDCSVVIRDWIYAHETLATGILAVVVGFATIWTMNYHYSKTKRWRDEDRKNQFTAMETKFVLHLVEIMNYKRNSVRLAFMMASRDVVRQENLVAPLSDRVIDDFCQLISLADGALKNKLASLFHLYQINNSRSNTALETDDEEFAEPINSDPTQEELDEAAKYDGVLISSCLLLLEINALFNILRGRAEAERLDDINRGGQLGDWMMRLEINVDDWPKTLERFRNDYPTILRNRLV